MEYTTKILTMEDKDIVSTFTEKLNSKKRNKNIREIKLYEDKRFVCPLVQPNLIFENKFMIYKLK